MLERPRSRETAPPHRGHNNQGPLFSRQQRLWLGVYTALLALSTSAVTYAATYKPSEDYFHTPTLTTSTDTANTTPSPFSLQAKADPNTGCDYRNMHLGLFLNDTDPETAHHNAFNCQVIMGNMAVAMVNYTNAPAKDLEYLTQDVQTQLYDASDGMIDIKTFDIINASSTARSEFEQRLSNDGCEESTDRSSWGSKIADDAMPNLSKYDRIIAITNSPDCAGWGGIGTLNDKYAEVYGYINTDYSGREAFETHVISHELLHTLGLGHNSTIGLDGDTDESKDRNITTFTIDGSVNEYGGDGIMGVGYSDGLSIAERFLLEWPYREYGQGKIKALDFTHLDGPLNMDGLDLAYAHLDQPIVLYDEDGSERKFDTLFIEQYEHTWDDGTASTILSVYAGDDMNNLVEIGRTFNPQTWHDFESGKDRVSPVAVDNIYLGLDRIVTITTVTNDGKSSFIVQTPSDQTYEERLKQQQPELTCPA